MIGTSPNSSSARSSSHQLEPADVGQLDVGDDQVGLEGRAPHPAPARLSVTGLRLVAMRREQVAEQLDVEGIVLDNQDLGQTILPIALTTDGL